MSRQNTHLLVRLLLASPAIFGMFSAYAAAHPEVAELEINPLLVSPSGATALDARIVKHQ